MNYFKVALLVLSLCVAVSCGSDADSDRPPVEDRVYCSGDADLPIDFEAEPKLRVFCIRDQEDLDFFIKTYGSLGTYQTLDISFFEGDTLKALRAVEFDYIGALRVENNSNLKNLEGFESLQKAAGILINSNGKLSNLKGLEHVASLDDILTITSNNALQDVDMPGLIRIEESNDQSIRISANRTLKVVSGFNKMAFVDNMGIFENPALERVEGFNALTSTLDGVAISNNPKLTRIDGFSSLRDVGSKCAMAKNPNLPECFAEAFCERVKSAETKEIYTFGNDVSATCE